MADVSGIPFGHFILTKRLARGGMAEVFLARQHGPEGFDRRVALKRILPHLVEAEAFVRMFLDEARLAARLAHPNIVHIYEFGKVDEHYFIAMEYVDGIHAGALIKHGATGEKLPLPLVARIGADACAGLHYAHALEDQHGRPLRIVHRDVSPPNLMVSFDGVVKLVDFGIAKAVSHVEQTRPGVVKGKYAYMSPEQTTSTPLDGRSDVFSLALVLWELIAGRVAVSRTDPVEAMRTIRDGRIPPIESARPDVPASLSRALGHALRVSPAERCSALELGLALEGFIKASPELGTSLELSQWTRARFRRANVTGEQPSMRAVPDGTRPATVAATAAATSATVAATQASTSATEAMTEAATEARPGATVASTEVTEAMPGADNSTSMTTAANGRHLSFLTEAELATQVVRTPPSFLPSSEQLGIPTTGGGQPQDAITATELTPRRTRRILLAALITVSLGAVAMVALRGPGARQAAAPTAPPPTDAARPVVPPPLPPPPPDAAVRVATAADAAPPVASAVEIVTRPPGATVTLGDGPSMITPARFVDVAPGDHPLRITLTGYRPLERTVTVAAGERRTVEYALTRAPTADRPPIKPRHKKGKLTARTRPYSVVYLGSKKLGVTPFANVPLPAGHHTLTFKNPKRKPYRLRVTIEPGKTKKLDFSLP